VTLVLWDVDTQVDFCHPDGKLYVPGAAEVLPAMERLVRWARDQRVVHVASADDHQFGDPEISSEPDFHNTYPPHCLRGTPGAERVAETRQLDPLPLAELVYPPGQLAQLVSGRREILLLKRSFDVFTNPSAEGVLDLLQPSRVVVFGVATDVCDDAAIRGLRRRGYEVSFVEDASSGLDEARVAACTEHWRSLGVSFTSVDEVVGAVVA
jgi:nicotinamidase/pyrazinamidase